MSINLLFLNIINGLFSLRNRIIIIFKRIQRHAETRIKQLGMWMEVLLGYCKTNKIWKITKSVFMSDIGMNQNINRQVST